MNDRGMKKWAPYKSLNEQETFLNQMREKRSRIEKPIISQDLAEQINYILLNHNNKELLFTFYKNGDWKTSLVYAGAFTAYDHITINDHKIFVQVSAPSNPSDGDIWIQI